MKLSKMLLLAGLTAALTLSTNAVFAQQGGGGGRGNFDPAQMRQRMLDTYRERLDIKDDAEWNVIAAQIGKVFDARMAIGMPGRGMMGARNRGGNNADTNNNNNRPQRPGATPSAAEDALQKAIDAKAPAAEIKAKLEAYRADVKAKEAKLEKAQDDLKKLLTPQQEAVAVLGGLLK